MFVRNSSRVGVQTRAHRGKKKREGLTARVSHGLGAEPVTADRHRAANSPACSWVVMQPEQLGSDAGWRDAAGRQAGGEQSPDVAGTATEVDSRPADRSLAKRKPIVSVTPAQSCTSSSGREEVVTLEDPLRGRGWPACGRHERDSPSTLAADGRAIHCCSRSSAEGIGLPTRPRGLEGEATVMICW